MVDPKRLIDGSQLTGSAATYYTSPALTKTRIQKLVFCNTTAGAVAVTLYLIPSGGSAGATNTVWSAKTLAAGETRECYEAEGHVLEAGGFIQALGLNVTIQASGDLITG
jgi:hypothetical protein